MRNVPVVCAGAMAILSVLALGGCSKQEAVSPKPPEQKPLQDGADQPITLSDSGSVPGTDKKGVGINTVALNLKSSPAPGSNMAPVFSSWPNNGNGNANVTDIYPPYSVLDGIQVTVNGATPPTTTYCNMSPSKCHLKVWYGSANPTIFFDYDAQGSHLMTLKSTMNDFDKYTNWTSPSMGNDIINPTSSTISQVSIDTGGTPTVVQCPMDCVVAIQVK